MYGPSEKEWWSFIRFSVVSLLLIGGAIGAFIMWVLT